jgi:serine/threonine protein kinase
MAMVAIAQHQQIGRYEILGSLARGGMAELFVARLPGVEGFAKHVVIKRVLPELARDRAFVDMFLAEARLAATLDHQNIVHVHDIGQDAEGYFLVMEHLYGADVGSILGTVTRFGGELPRPIAVEIARAACAGLHHAHERRTAGGELLGLVHRDVSPSNLFVTFDGAVKLLDFGIAKAAQVTAPPRTRSGALRGKLPYMSPEQCSGEPLDRRSDVFSLAVVLWEMTVGTRLYGGAGEPELAVMRAIVETDAPRPSAFRPGYPAELERIVMRGLARAREARYQTADELQAELEGFARTASAWSSAREMARFMADAFPDRADVWRDHERRGTVSLLVLGRQTTPLPPPPVTGSAPGLGAPPPAAAAIAAGAPVVSPSAAALPAPGTASAPAVVATTAPGTASAPAVAATTAGPATSLTPARSRPILAAAAIAGVVAAIALGFALGRAQRPSDPSPPSPAAAAPSPASPAAAAAAGSGKPARGPIAEDPMWFQPDDYLVSRHPYRGERLDELVVAKPLKPPVPATATAFLDANGNELATEYYWRTRAATPDDLAVGALAFCRCEYHATEGKPPADRTESRMRPWMLGRVTDVTRLDAGEVTIASTRCAIGAVRVER